MSDGGATRNFMRRMLGNLDQSARDLGRPNYGAQSVASCLSLYGLCTLVDPDFVLDVGTAAGASCLSLAYALKGLGKDPTSQLLTVCVHQGRWWGQGVASNEKLARDHGIAMRDIPTVDGDFRTVDPPQAVKDGAPTFLFYDIHDYDDGSVPPSRHLLDVWVPAISRGIVAVHDAYTPKHADRHPANALHFGLGIVYGRLEIVPIVEYLNARRGQLMEVPGAWILYFCVEDGEVK